MAKCRQSAPSLQVECIGGGSLVVNSSQVKCIYVVCLYGYVISSARKEVACNGALSCCPRARVYRQASSAISSSWSSRSISRVYTWSVVGDLVDRMILPWPAALPNYLRTVLIRVLTRVPVDQPSQHSDTHPAVISPVICAPSAKCGLGNAGLRGMPTVGPLQRLPYF